LLNVKSTYDLNTHSKFKAKATFSTWFYRIVVNESLKKIKKKKLQYIPLDEVLFNDNSPDIRIEAIEQLHEEEQREIINSYLNQGRRNVPMFCEEGVNEEIFEECKEKLTLLLHPFVPHITEEVWEIMNKKGFLSLASWPSYNEKLLNPKNEFKWKLKNNIIEDINHIKIAIKKEELENISIIIADEWKYQFYKILLSLIDETKNQGKIMKKIMQTSDLKPYSKLISQIVAKVLKNVGKFPRLILSTKEEYQFFQDIKSMIMKKCNCRVEILIEKESNEQKATQSLPGKPAIMVVAVWLPLNVSGAPASTSSKLVPM